MERELLLLGLLRRSDMHGYQLHEFINQNLSSCTDLKKPTAYYLLDKMAERGWIEVSEEVQEESNRPPRRVYALTAEGENIFQRLLRENLAAYSPATFTDTIGLAFIDAMPKQEAAQLLGKRRETLAKALEAARQVPVHAGSMQFIIDHQVHHLNAELNWLDGVITQLKENDDSRR